MVASLFRDTKGFIVSCRNQDVGFYLVCAYIVFSYVRPQAIYPALNFLPWTQLCILFGLAVATFRREIKFGSAGFSLLMFVIVIWLSSLFSQNSEYSFSKLDVILVFFAEVIFFISCIKTGRQLQLILGVFFLGMLKMSLFGAKTWVLRGFGFTKWGIAGPAGFFSNSGEFSLLMAMVFVLSIGFLIGIGKHKSYLLVLPITAIMTVLGASSRGSQLAIIFGVLFMLYCYKKFSFKYLLILGLVFYGAISLMPQEQIDRFRNMGSDSTSQSRMKYWSAGWDMMKEYPWLGVGYFGFAQHYHAYYKKTDPDDYLSNRMEVSHNSFVEVGSTTGFTGLAVYLIILGLIWRYSDLTLRNSKNGEGRVWLADFAIGIKSALIVYVFGSSFMSVAFYPYIYLMLMFSFVAYRASKLPNSYSESSD